MSLSTFTKFCLSIFLLLSACLMHAKVLANDTHGNHAVWGLGQSSCNGYIKARESSAFGDFKNFLMGYLTAYNTVATDNYSVSGPLDLNGILTRLDAFCQKTPTDSFDHALQILVAELRSTRTRKANTSQSWGRYSGGNSQ